MKRATQIKFKSALFGFCFALLCAFPAHADDTEIFFGASEPITGSVLPNVLFILDTSGSMSTTVTGTGKSRMENMKEAFQTIMNSTTNINAGLMRFNDPGGPILFPVTSIESTITTSTSGALSTSANSRITAGSDDAEELASGTMDLTSPTLDMAYGSASGGTSNYNTQTSTGNNDAGETLSGGSINRTSTTITMDSTQINGFYFPSVAIPNGASIISAKLTFTARRSDSSDVTLRFYGQASDSAASISTTAGNLSGRTKTTALVNWAAPAWSQDNTYVSPDLSTIISEIVNRTGWASGNNLMILQTHVSGSRRRARSYDDSPSSSARLDIVYSTTPASAETIGLRFEDVGIPQGATITSAAIEFTAAQTTSGTTNLVVHGEATDDATTYTSGAYNMSGRSKTSASTNWAPSAWNTGDVVQTPSLTSVVQEIVNRSAWCGNNAMAFQISGTDTIARIAQSYEGNANSAPILRVTYDAATVPASPGGCINQYLVYRVKTSSDDAEETNSGGAVSLSSNTLDLVSTQTNGLRFDSVMINQGATILEASIDFTARYADSSTANTTFYGEASDDAGVFTSANNDITSRTKTGASVAWSAPSWSSGSAYTSPDLKTIVQQVVDRTGWAPGNALTFIQTSSGGTRRAHTYDNSPGNAPLLRLKVQSGGVATTITKTVRQELIDIVNDFVPSGYTPIVDTLYEGTQYYRGGPVLYGLNRGNASTYGRVSHSSSWTGGTLVRPAGCTDTNLNSSTCATEEITGNPAYTTPIDVECQGNYIVLLTDGEANHNNSTTLIPSLIGGSCAAATTSGETCGRELADFLHTEDQLSSLADPQTVATYTIGFNLDAGGDAGAIQFLKDIASNGGGTYSSASTAADLSNIFQSIIGDILAVNTTFVAPGATVNQFNRLTNRNEIYFSLFKPGGEPKWDGNLKRYGIDADAGTVVDKDGALAVDANTGFFKTTATSYWSSLVDGAEVKLGGGAGTLDASTRKTYTNTTGTGNVTLSATANALSETNTAVTKTLLGIDTWTDADRIKLLQWAHGVDVLDSDGDGNTTETRLEMGDPLHSRPVIATYGGTDIAPDSTVFVGTNEGYLHAIDTDNGNEVFSFVPRELLVNLHLFYDNLTSTTHPYGLDGPITTWIKDVDGDGQVESPDDHVYIYVGMRRGGRNYYALDVTDRANPILMWTLYGGAGDFSELGQSWSSPLHTKLKLGGTVTDVLVFGGGYDTDHDTKTTRSADTEGRAIFIVDATTGALIWSGGPGLSFTENFTGMQYAIPSDIRAVDITGDGLIDQLYVGDMGGQLWRFDIDNTATNATQLVTGGVIANLNDDTAAGNRRFYYAPDVSLIRNAGSSYLSIAIGSGWREHPLDTVVQDRFYVIKDYNMTGAPVSYTAATESTLFDATSNVIGEGTATAKAAALAELNTKNGWYIRLENSGEKVLAESTTINNQALFTTYQPNVGSSSVCTPTLGVGRLYVVSILDATPTQNLDGVGEDTALIKSDRVKTLVRGGIPPSVISLFTEDSTGQIKPLTLVGPETQVINFGDLSYKTYWEEVR